MCVYKYVCAKRYYLYVIINHYKKQGIKKKSLRHVARKLFGQKEGCFIIVPHGDFEVKGSALPVVAGSVSCKVPAGQLCRFPRLPALPVS